MSVPDFGTAPASSRSHIIAERAYTAMLLARDLRDGSTVLICKKVISMLRMGRAPLDSDVIHIGIYLRKAFR